VLYALRRADDALVLGHRLSEWCGHAPALEEDMALANMGLDLLGQARSLYSYAAEVEAAGNDEDDYAYHRDAPQYRNLLLVEQPNGDFARTILRQFFYAAFADLYWRAMMAFPRPHAGGDRREVRKGDRLPPAPFRRMGDPPGRRHGGKPPPRRRGRGLSVALYRRDVRGRRRRARADRYRRGAGPRQLSAAWDKTVTDILAEATLDKPAAGWMQKGGRSGRHSEHLGHLLAVMQSVPRAIPGAIW
jgi:ring-1,2-phenylacetyl-CoA epoxidase subunit PaaC